MNIDKLQVGQVIKNYKEMCMIVNEQVKGGKSKQLQIEDWKRYFNWKNEGYKFIITEIYPEPLPKIDGRVNNGGNNTKYDDLFDKLIINSLLENDGYIEESYFGLLYYVFEIFTHEYKKLFDVGYRRYAEINGISKGLVMTYQQKIRNVIETALKTSLNRLQRQNIITYDIRINIRDTDLNENFADTIMENKIKKFEKIVYDELEMTAFKRVNPRKNRQFKNKVSKYVGIMSYWNVYVIKLNNMNTKSSQDTKEELILKFIESVEKNTRNTKSKDKLGDEFYPYSYEKFNAGINLLTDNFMEYR